MKIFLTGFPGCGKSSLAGEAAASLKVPFFDTDKLVENKTGFSVQNIFESQGEDFFRRTESEILRSLVIKKNGIIAVGGGLPCYHDNMKWMNENGLTIYLEASAAFLFHRLVKEKKSRPLISKLSDIELMIYITETLSVRKFFYDLAQVKVNAETISPAKFLGVLKKREKN